MGRNYSFDLYFFARDLERTFSIISEHCIPSKHPTRLVFPDGRILTPAFATGLAERVNSEVMIGTTAYLRVPIDNLIEHYLIGSYGLPEYWPVDVATGREFNLPLRVYLRIGDQVADITLMAPTTSVSQLLDESRGIRDVVIDIARESRALLLLFDREDDEYELLWRNDDAHLPVRPADHPNWTALDTSIVNRLIPYFTK